MRQFFLFMVIGLFGCSSAHIAGPDGGDTGTRDADMSPRCEAFSGGAGSPCSFVGSCDAPISRVRECCRTTLSCVDGAAVFTEQCIEDDPRTVPWGTCSEYVMSGGICTSGGAPGDPCDEATFGTCATGASGPGGCVNEVVCVAGSVVARCPSTGTCADTTEPPAGVTMCRGDSECASPEYCHREGDPVCGPCMEPSRDCAVDADCGSGARCESYLTTCACGGESTRCVANCVTGAECESGELCGSDGVCTPMSCEDRYECPENTRCGPPGAGDEHSCARIICTADSECDCGFCVRDRCVSSIGVCSLPTA